MPIAYTGWIKRRAGMTLRCESWCCPRPYVTPCYTFAVFLTSTADALPTYGVPFHWSEGASDRQPPEPVRTLARISDAAVHVVVFGGQDKSNDEIKQC